MLRIVFAWNSAGARNCARSGVSFKKTEWPVIASPSRQVHNRQPIDTRQVLQSRESVALPRCLCPPFRRRTRYANPAHPRPGSLAGTTDQKSVCRWARPVVTPKPTRAYDQGCQPALARARRARSALRSVRAGGASDRRCWRTGLGPQPSREDGGRPTDT